MEEEEDGGVMVDEDGNIIDEDGQMMMGDEDEDQ